uniref:Fanconi anemia group I protein n=2 Tax=Clytia hemisphaerica TaxID=252671 RepID=A0A7M5UV95_9CNID
METKVTNDLVGFLAVELDKIPLKELVELIGFFLELVAKGAISNSKNLEIFSKSLSIVSVASQITHKETIYTGEHYHSFVIQEVCEREWKKEMILPLLTAFREIELKEESLKTVIQKVLESFNDMPLEEIPSLIYQVLLLSVKGCKMDVLDGIITFFHQQSDRLSEGEQQHAILRDEDEIEKNKKELLSVEGTSLLHVMFAVKQDQSLGREFVKYLKGKGDGDQHKVSSPFSIALILSMTQVHRLEEQLFDFLKSNILKIFKEDELRKSSKWINELFPKEFPIEENIINVAKNSKTGWDHVSHGLITLAFNLIDTYAAKQNDIFTITSDATTPQQRACKLGAQVIQEIFQAQDTYRGAILEQILDLIITRSSLSQQHYLDLLSSLVSKVPQIVIDCLPKFREVFDYIPMVTVQTAEGILRAVLPLMRVSMSIKDSLILVLRKSMFSKNLESRKIAVMGFLLVLKHFKIDSENVFSLSSQVSSSQMFSCSQLEVSSSSRYNTDANEALCLELIGSLRKSLTQHGLVRQLIYQSIYEVICKNPKLSESALDLLYCQFMKYFHKEEDQIPPISLDKCVSNRNDEVILIEPLDHLVSALQLCTKKSGKRLDQVLEEDEALSFLLDNVEESFESLTRRMLKTDLEDFNLDKTADYQLNSEDGKKNRMQADILFGIYEILIEYNFMKEEKLSVEITECIHNIHDKLQAVHDVINESGNNAGKKGKPAQVKNNRQCLMSFKCLTKMLSTVLCDNEVENEEIVSILRQSCSLAKYLATAIVARLHQLVTRRECDGAGGKNMDHLFRQCLVLSRVFLQHINGESMISVEVLRKNKGKRLGNICLEGLNCIVGFVCNHLPHEIRPLLESLDFHPDVVSQNDMTSQGSIIYRVVRRMQRLTVKVIMSPDEDLGPKEAQVLINMLSYLTPHLADQTEVVQVYSWYSRLCIDHSVDDPLLTKTIFTKFLNLHHQCKGSLSTISKVCQDIHSRIGDIDEDIEVEESLHFKIITEKNSVPTIFLLIGQHIEKVLDEIDSVLTKLKNNSKSTTDDIVKDKQQRICQSLIGIVLSIHELVQSAFTPGTCADSITKVATKVYTILGTLTKYFMVLCTQKTGTVDQKFERLVKLTGSHLAQQIYAMISYMQSTQTNEQASMNTTNKKNKTNKVGKSRAMKESRSIPNLIYSIEQFERYLIQLSKKTKIDLMGNIKRSTARDFRINAASLEAALHEIESEEEEENNENEENADISNIQPDTSITGQQHATGNRNRTIGNKSAAAEVLDLTKEGPPASEPVRKRKKLFSVPRKSKDLVSTAK